MASMVSSYISKSLDQLMKQIDGGTGGSYVYSSHLDDLDRHRKQLPQKTVPDVAVLARVVEAEQPDPAEVVVADKAGDGVFAVWKEGRSALAYSISWGRTVHAVFENAAMNVRPKRLSHKGFEVPALQIEYPQFRAPVLVVGVLARTPRTFNQSRAQSCIDQMAAILAGAQ